MLIDRQNMDKLEEVFSKLSTAQMVVLDVETSGLSVWTGDRICGIGLGFEDDSTYYLPFRHQLEEEGFFPILAGLEYPSSNLPLELLPKLFSYLRKVPIILGHNIKFDLAALFQDGFDITDTQELRDTIILGRLLLPGKYPGLKLEQLGKKFLGLDFDEYKKAFRDYLKKHKWNNRYDKAPADKVGPYCEKDLACTRDLFRIMLPKIEETKQTRVCEQEWGTLLACWDMEREGLCFDEAYLLDKIPKLRARLVVLQQQMNEVAGYEFNVGSNKQLNEVMHSLGLYSQNKGKPKIDKKTGAETEGDDKWDIVELMRLDHEICGLILEYRGIDKILSTYFEPLLKWQTNTLHGTFRSWGTVSGRMSSVEPNLQNLTRGILNLLGDEISEEALMAFQHMLGTYQGQVIELSGRQTKTTASQGLSSATVKGMSTKYDEDNEMMVSVRRLYIPPPDYKLYFLDVEQMEMRVFVDYLEDETLTAQLEKSGFDFHAHVAKSVWHVSESSDLWKFYRTLAKAVNFGLIYGIGLNKLAAQIQKSVEEARQYKAEYFNRFPKARTFISRVSQTVERRGWVMNRFNRRYWILPDPVTQEIKSYVGVNYLVQGTSADIIKNRMIAIRQYLRKNKTLTRMISQVHDELIFKVHYSEERQIIPELKDIFEQRQIRTYLPVDISIGADSWGQKKKICKSCYYIDETDRDQGIIHRCSNVMIEVDETQAAVA